MAELILTDAYVSIAANDLSGYVKAVNINYSAESQEITAMGDSTRRRLPGLKDWSAELEFNQDYDAAGLDAIMFPLVGTTVAIEIRPKNAAPSTNNPKYTGNGVVESYPPLSGSIGEAVTASVTVQGSGDLARATA